MLCLNVPVILLCSLSTETLLVEGLKTKNDVKVKVTEWKEEVKERSLTHKKTFWSSAIVRKSVKKHCLNLLAWPIALS